MPLNIALADALIVGVLVISTLISLWRGFAREALSLLSWAAAFVVSMLFYARVAERLADHVDEPRLRLIVAFVLLFVLVLIIGAAISFLLGALIDMTGLSGTDRALGSVFGLVRGAIIVLVLLIVLQPVLKPERYDWWRESRLIPHFLLMEDWARETAAELAALLQRLTQPS